MSEKILFFFFVSFPLGLEWESTRHFTCCCVTLYVTQWTLHGFVETVRERLFWNSCLPVQGEIQHTYTFIPLCDLKMVRKVNRKLLNCLRGAQRQEIIEELQTPWHTHTHSRTLVFVTLEETHIHSERDWRILASDNHRLCSQTLSKRISLPHGPVENSGTTMVSVLLHYTEHERCSSFRVGTTYTICCCSHCSSKFNSFQGRK